MKRLCLMGILVAGAATIAIAQPPGGGPGRRGPGGPDGGPDGDFRPPPPPFIAVLDVDRDHVLSAEEIKGAPEALLKLDKNGDGKLTEDEFMGPPRGGPRGPGGADDDRRDGEGPPRGPRNRQGRQRGPDRDARGDDRGPPPGRGGQGRGPQDFDGPPRPPSPDQFVEHALDFDADKDGKLSADELRKFAEEIARHRPGGPGGGPDAPPPPPERPRRPD